MKRERERERAGRPVNGTLLDNCEDVSGECFARKCGRCVILKNPSYPCHFKKPEMLVTNGVKYPEKHPSKRLEESNAKDNT